MDLDHVALALHNVTDTLTALVGDLGASVIDGGHAVGFRIVQVRLGRRPHLEDPGEGMTVELMEPWATDRFDFLVRFLERNGEGPHHLTFKVHGIGDEIARLAASGYSPVRTQLTNPWWREAFYHPNQTFGTVIQLAEATFRPDLVADKPPSGDDDFDSAQWWPEPPPRAEARAVLRRVVLGVPDVPGARDFFEGVLLGRATEEGDGSVEVAWPGGGRVLLESRPGARPGIDRFECERDGPAEELVIGGARVKVAPG